MIAKIEIYNDNNDLVSKYDILPSEERVDYTSGYEIHKYYFNFVYAKCVPQRQEEVNDNADTILWSTIHDAQAVQQKMME